MRRRRSKGTTMTQRTRARLAATACLVGGALLAGCTSVQQSPLRPEPVLQQYARALDAGRFDDAYALMSLEFRKRYDRAEFVRMLKERPEELQQITAQLHARPARVHVSAQVGYGDGEAMTLAVEGGQWRIASDVLAFYGQSSPAEALRSFVRAIERRRYDVVLRFVPKRWATAMTVDKLRAQWEGGKRAELRRLHKNLKASLGALIEQSGDAATMPYGENFKVVFVREDGVWKIEDPD
jgi:hypothetical protein